MAKEEKSLAIQPESSRKAAVVIQEMPMSERAKFIQALENATQIKDLPEPYLSYMENGYKTADSK